jgi:acetylornithine deacetylase
MSLSRIPGTCEEALARMVGIDSVNPNYGGRADGQRLLSDEIASWAQSWGLRCQRLPAAGGDSNLLVSCELGEDLPWLIFDSHLDTVGVGGMTVPPFTLTEKRGYLHGRGSCDTKGSGAAMLWALRNWAASPARARRNVGVLFTLDEESGMTGATAFAEGLLKRLLPQLKGIVVGEPTGLHPVIATNGVLRWRTIARGVAAHSSTPSKGRSAISAIMRAVDAFESRYVPTVSAVHPLTGRAAASINVISGGSQVNVIPDYCEIHCDRRLVPGETAAVALAGRDLVWAELSALEHDRVYVVPPLSESSCETFYAWARPVFKPLGIDPTARGAPFVTNGSIYAEAGAPVLVLGPGHAAQAHTHDEWLARDQLAQAARLYEALMALPAP